MLQTGTKAPAFSLPDQNGQIHTLEEYKGKKVILLTLSEDSKAYANEDVEAVLEMGSRQKLEEVSSRIFTLLRKVDDYHADLVLIEGVTKDGLGLAIMNRLLRSCEYDYTEI